MKIEIGVENGRRIIKIDGGVEDLWKESRVLTGTTDEDGDGIFGGSKMTTFSCGEYSREFDFSELSLFVREKEKENLLSRIEMVRGWTQSLDYSVQFEI